jgi:DNA-binding beta-propeller fold protein YncE
MKIRYLILFLCSLICLNSLPVFAETEEIYRFERMWPVLQQPWYFDELWDIAISQQKHVYVVDRQHNRVQKLTLDGHLISHFGTFDDGFKPIRIAVDSQENVYVLYRCNDLERCNSLEPRRYFIKKFNALGELISDKYAQDFDQISDIAVDKQDHLYILAGTEKQRFVQKLTPNADLKEKWFVGQGSDIAIYDNYLYLSHAGYSWAPKTNKVEKYSLPEGKLEISWGNRDGEAGMFKNPQDIAVDSEGNVYVADTGNHRIQKFTSEGEFLMAWREETKRINGSEIIQSSSPLAIKTGEWLAINLLDGLKIVFSRDVSEIESFLNNDFQPIGIALDPQDNVYVTCGFPYHINKYTSEGTLSQQWASYGNSDKQFNAPIRIARGKSGNLYVTDMLNHRVSKFTADGQIIQWGKSENGEDQFFFPTGIATDTEENVYVVDTGNVRIQKFKANGEFITQWSGLNLFSDNGFLGATAIAIDKNNNVYVVDSLQKRIHKFTSEGELIKIFGDELESEFNLPLGITVDNNNNLYVVDINNHNIKQFTTEGDFIKEWGKQGHENGLFYFPSDVATDDNGNVYISDSNNNRIQKFTSEGTFITQWGEFGTNPGQLSKPMGLTVSPDGERVYVVETVNNRIQVFNRNRYDIGKAIIVAGMRSEGDQLWNSTQMVANYAYRALTYQGFTKDSIYYLSADIQLDLDDNGEPDDVDAIPTEKTLKYAITEWAKEGGNNNLTLYMTDHGGSEEFQLNEKFKLTAIQLNDWLDTLQIDMTGSIKIIYDACQSGSFVPKFVPPDGKNRIVITSAAAEQNAYFNSGGSLSFSSFFWNHIFNGIDIASAFSQTREAIDYLQGQTSQKQTPQLDANSNGIANELIDFEKVIGINIGNGTKYQMNAPVIDSISVLPSQTLMGTNTASITVEVSDNEGIAKVWAVVRSPADLKRIVTGETIKTLPSFEFNQIEKSNQYEATYNGFTEAGTYQLAVYARDREENTSIPKTITISVESDFKNKAIIVAGDLPAPIQNTEQAYDTLKYQGYSDENIYYLSNNSQQGVDVLTTLDNVKFALTEWPQNNTQDVVIYLEDWGDETTFMLNSTETLPFVKLDEWLDTLQNNIKGAITVIYEGPYSGYLLSALTTPTGKERIVITSMGQSEINCLNKETLELYFSQTFWQTIRKGTENIHEAFKMAKIFARDNVIKERYPELNFEQRETLLPQLDDNGNGIGNEDNEGDIAKRHNIGTGVITADIEPLMGKVSPLQILKGERAATLWVENVTTIGTSATVLAIINPPCHTDEKATKIKLESVGDGKYQAQYDKFLSEGDYRITFFAEDESSTENRTRRRSLPKRTLVQQNQSVKVYCNGELVQINLPTPLTKNHDYYVALQLPDGSLFSVKTLNQFEPFDINAISVWEGVNEQVINQEITPSTTHGEYKFYWMQSPKGSLPNLDKLNQFTFYVEE